MKKINKENGQTLLFVALSMTILLGFAALATDVGVLLHAKRQIQAVADSAAIAGATAALGVQNGSNAQLVATTAGQLDASNYGFSTSQVTITTPPTDDINSAFNNPGYVEAVVTETEPTPLISAFLHLFNPSSTYSGMTVKARAVAADTITSNGCVYIPNPTGYNPAADLGGNSLLLTPNCGVSINGNLTMSGSSQIQAGFVGVSGGINFVGNKASIPGESGTGVAPLSDPLSFLSQPKYAPTAGTTQGGACGSTPSGTGTCIYDYQGGNLSGPLNAGVYFFDVPVNIVGSLTGSGVTIFVSGTQGFYFKNNGTINLTPPGWGSPCPVGGSNPYCGVLIDAPTDVASSNACTHGAGPNTAAPGTFVFDFGSSVTSFSGAVYAPQAHMYLQDQGSSTTLASDLDIGTLCQQSANITISGQAANNPITKIGLVE